MPDERFSSWHAWEDRETCPVADRPGVYCLAVFDQAPDGPADPLDPQVIWIGMFSKSLRSRWNAYDRWACKSKRDTGGWVAVRDNKESLHVAVLATGDLGLAKKQLLEKFASLHGGRPRYNGRSY